MAGYWGSIWDFIPLEYYEDLKAERLDPIDSAALIEKTDMVHYDIMADFHTNLQKCVNDYGINISIIAGTDVPCVSGLRTNGDALIRVTDSTGALCAPYGERFTTATRVLEQCVPTRPMTTYHHLLRWMHLRLIFPKIPGTLTVFSME